jgi:hypothetical protein
MGISMELRDDAKNAAKPIVITLEVRHTLVRA